MENKIFIILFNVIFLISLSISYIERKSLWQPIAILFMLNSIIYTLAYSNYTLNTKVLLNINALLGYICGLIFCRDDMIGSIISFLVIYLNLTINDHLSERILLFVVVLGFVILVPQQQQQLHFEEKMS